MPGAIAFLRRRGYRQVEEHAFPHTSLTLYLYAQDLQPATDESTPAPARQS